MSQIEFGDFQTPKRLAKQVINLLKKDISTPEIVIEPTCGLGNFIDESHLLWSNKPQYIGFEINNEYYKATKKRFSQKRNVEIKLQNFFTFDWKSYLEKFKNNQVLVLGNPPWVNSATIGLLGGDNLPKKSNFQKLKGFEAKMGKSNFDIAEWIIIELIESMRTLEGTIALLCKNATARKVLTYFWKKDIPIGEAKLYNIDAKKDFDVSVDACLFVLKLSKKNIKQASLFSSLLEDKKLLYRFGMEKEQLISNLDSYEKYSYLDGFSNYRWRSGLKHDASKVMELTLKEGKLINGFGDILDIEDTYVYPLLKSSDIGNGRLSPRKFVIVTQKRVGEETSIIRTKAPKTWVYLNQHINKLNARKSSIYKKQPLFSIFGIGDYSFASWKVAISALYKNIEFCTVSPYKGKAMMLDDTCYFIPCNSKEEAEYWTRLLNSSEMKKFLSSIVFIDSKRAITVDILKRMDMGSLSRKLGSFEIGNRYLQFIRQDVKGQASFVFEEGVKYN